MLPCRVKGQNLGLQLLDFRFLHHQQAGVIGRRAARARVMHDTGDYAAGFEPREIFQAGRNDARRVRRESAGLALGRGCAGHVYVERRRQQHVNAALAAKLGGALREIAYGLGVSEPAGFARRRRFIEAQGILIAAPLRGDNQRRSQLTGSPGHRVENCLDQRAGLAGIRDVLCAQDNAAGAECAQQFCRGGVKRSARNAYEQVPGRPHGCGGRLWRGRFLLRWRLRRGRLRYGGVRF